MSRHPQVSRLPVAFALIATVFFSLCTMSARGDGLFYQLPPDGSSVTFDLEMSGGVAEERKMTGSLRMASVGETDNAGEKGRWIEFKMTMNAGDNAQTIIAKVHIPEKFLQPGESPFANFTKGWLKLSERDVKEIKEAMGSDAGPLPAFLSGPLNNQQKLEAVEVESALGKLKCQGVTGDIELKDGSNDVKMTFENRLHDKAPFGVITSKITFDVRRDNEQRESGTLSLKLASVGEDAKSELPEHE